MAIRSHTCRGAREYFDYLNHAYLAVHKTKEDLFWATYMATSDDQKASFAPRAPTRSSSATRPS